MSNKTACDFKSSFLSTKSFFVKKGFIDYYQNIKDVNGFRKANKYWSDRAKARYGTEGMLFTEQSKAYPSGEVYFQASPNMEVFAKIDEIRGTSPQLSLDLNQVTSQGNPDEKLDSTVTTFLSSIGVHINSLEEIKVKDKDGNELSIVAKSNLLRGIIDIAKNKRGRDTLSEEAAHFLVELLGDSHPLVQQMIANIDQFGIYQEVLAEYGDLEAYTGDDKKLRKEAVGKLIAQILSGTYEKQDAKIGWFQNLLNKLFDFLGVKLGGDKAKAVTDAIADYEKAAQMILANDTSELMSLENLRKLNEGKEDEMMYQVSPEMDKQRTENIEKLSVDTVTKDQKGYKLVTTGERVKQRVTDIIKRINFEIYHRYDRSDKRSKNAATMGTVIHAAMQHIFNARAANERLSETELRKKVAETVKESDELKDLKDLFFNKNLDGTVIGVLNKTADQVMQTVNEIEEQIKKQTGMTEEEWQARKPVFFTEKSVYNPITDTAGTIDLMVVHSNGAISIFDWKSMTFTMHNKEIIADIEPSKRYVFDAQMTLYKSALVEGIGADNFGVVRIVPINLQLDSNGDIYRIQTFNKDNTSTYLQHIPTSAETTGIPELDANLERWITERTNLQKQYFKNKKLKMLLPKIKRLDNLIRNAQTKREFSIVTDAINDLQDRFRAREVWSSYDDADYLSNLLEELHLYTKSIDDAIEYLTEQKAPGAKIAEYENARSATLVLEKAIQNKVAEMFVKVRKPGVLLGWFSRTFAKLSDYSRGTFQELFSIVNKNYEYVRQEVNKDIKTLTQAVENLGMSASEAYKMMYNPKSGNLYVRTSAQFYEDRKKAQEEKNIQWFLDNTDLQKVVHSEGGVKYRYKGRALEAFKKARKTTEDNLRSDPGMTFSSDEAKESYIKAQMLAFDKKYDISFATGSIFEFTMGYLYYNNNGKYDSAEWTAIQNNAGLKQYYDTYLSIVKKLNGLNGVEVDENFVASVHKSLLENATFAGGLDISALKESLIHLVATQQSDEFGGYISTDVDSDGKPIQRVPHLYTNVLTVQLDASEKAAIIAEVDADYDKEGWIKEGEEYRLNVQHAIDRAEQKKGLKFKSIDLTRSLILFARASYTHSIFSQTEGAMRLLRNSLDADYQKTTLTDWSGSVKRDKTDPTKVLSQQGVPEAEKETFDKFAKLHWYGDQGIGGKDATIEMAGRDISASKAANLFLRASSMSAMGLKPLLAFGNFMGGKMNAWMKATEGIYFNQSQWGKAQLMETKRDAKYAASVKFWEPSSHDLTLEKANKLSASKLTEWFTASNVYILHRLGTDSVSNNVLVAMLQNYGIDTDGTVKRLSKLPSGTKSLFELQELTEEGIKIEGLKQAEFEKFRAIVRNQMTQIMGEMTEADKNLANSTMALRFMMQFRNWMPGLIQPRFGKFRQSTIDNEFDVGRFQVLVGEFTRKGFAPKMQEFGKLAMEVMFLTKPSTNKEVTEFYYKKYLIEKRLTKEELSLEDFLELRTAKLKGMVREIQLYLAIFLAMLAAKAMIPDDKDDPLRQWAVILYRMTLRSYLEVGFFLNPLAAKQTLKGAIPQLTFVDNTARLLRSAFEEGYYLVADDDRPKNKKPKPTSYYLLKLTPGPAGTFVDLYDAYDTYKVGSGWMY